MNQGLLKSCNSLGEKKTKDLIQQGKALKKLRKQARMTQEFLAEKIEISVRHLSDIENGKSDPSLTISRRWIKVTGTAKPQHIQHLFFA
jgi:DNA-binding XRE family transcriptional regulator